MARSVMLGALVLIVTAAVARTRLQAQEMSIEIARPRLAAGDVDGDGEDEIIAGGRVGPFPAETAPREAGSGRVVIYRGGTRLWQELGRSPELHVVTDVAAGDLDGDGRDEVVAAGGDRVLAFRWTGGGLALLTAWMPGPGRVDRVAAADVTRDGGAEVVVARYLVGESSELGTTVIHVFTFEGETPVALEEVEVEGHVGDLACRPGGRDEPALLALERGWGDEGGQAEIYRWNGGFRPAWSGSVTGGARALLVSFDGPGRLVFGSLSGEAHAYLVTASGLRADGTEMLPPGVSVLLPRPGGWIVAARRGDRTLLRTIPGR